MAALHPFILDAQHHDGLRMVREGVIETGRELDRPLVDIARSQGFRGDECDVCPQGRQQMHVRSCDSGVGDVTNDDHRDPVEILSKGLRAVQSLTEGERVEQSLGGVFVRSVPGVDDARRQPARVGESPCCSRGAVPDHNDVGPHRFDGLRGVLEALALRQAGSRPGEGDHISGELLGGRFKTEPGPRRILKEKVGDTHTAQGGQFRHLARGQRGEFTGRVQKREGLFCGHPLTTQQMLHRSTLTPSS